MTSIAGVDEAGRGSVIGPLVIAGVLVDEGGLKALQRLGVKDSKLLTPERRKELSGKIKDVALRYAYSELSPAQIDRVVLHGVKYRRLNYLEMVAMARIIEELRPSKAIVDPCDVSPERCVREIRAMLPFKVEVLSERHADRITPSSQRPRYSPRSGGMRGSQSSGRDTETSAPATPPTPGRSASWRASSREGGNALPSSGSPGRL